MSKKRKNPVYKYPEFVSSVEIQAEEDKRFVLKLTIDNDKPDSILVILKNPSRATLEISDKTIYNVTNYIKKNINGNSVLDEIGSITFVNLIPDYLTDSAKLQFIEDGIINEENKKVIDKLSKSKDKVIIAWGDSPTGLKADYDKLVKYTFEVLDKNKNEILYVDKISKNGNPKHGQVWSYSDELKNYKDRPI